MFKVSNGGVYDAIQAAYIFKVTDNGLFLRFMHTIILSASSDYLYVCFVHVSVCACVQLEIHSPRNTNKIIDVRALT